MIPHGRPATITMACKPRASGDDPDAAHLDGPDMR